MMNAREMVTPQDSKISGAIVLESWFEDHADLAAVLVVLVGFLARLWAASGIFLNPDEALHFRLANQSSLALAYGQSVTAAHPPLLILFLYCWRALGTSDLWLRLPSVAAGAIFCWVFFKWLMQVTDRLTGFVGLLFVSLLLPIIMLAAEVRQYALLMAFVGSALYFLDRAFAENSVALMAASTLCLYLAMLTHYSAFLFASSLGIYALLWIFMRRVLMKVIVTWAVGQLGALALAAFLYKTHLSQIGAGESRTVLEGWMTYIRRSYFDRAHDNPLLFLVGHTFGVFQYLFGQLAVGDVVGVLFLVGVFVLLREKSRASRRLGLFLLLSFAIVGAASMVHVYPYGGTRHSALLIIPAIAGVSVAVVRAASGRWTRALAIVGVIVMLCLAFGRLRQPRMERADQSQKRMAAALEFVQQNVAPSTPVFVDYQTDLVLGHYLCQQRPVPLEIRPTGFEEFFCGRRHVASTGYPVWTFSSENFPRDFERAVLAMGLKPGDTVWVFQTGWGIDLPEQLQKHFVEFSNLHYESFGKNIKTFKLTVGQPMPSTGKPSARTLRPTSAPTIEAAAHSVPAHGL
jgi:hypothetical protein